MKKLFRNPLFYIDLAFFVIALAVVLLPRPNLVQRAWAIAGGLISGEGTVPQLAKFVPPVVAGGPTSNTIGESIIYDDGANIGIGTTSPQRLLHLRAAGAGRVGMRIENTSVGGSNWSVGSTDNTDAISGGRFAIKDDGQGLNRMVIDSSGNIGIGTATPNRGKLHVAQTTDSSDGGITSQNLGVTGAIRLWDDASANARIDGNFDGSKPILLNGSGTGNVGIGTTNPNAKLEVNNDRIAVMDGNRYWSLGAGRANGAGNGFPDNAAVDTGGTFAIRDVWNQADRLRIDNWGNVGIGTTNPGNAKTNVFNDGTNVGLYVGNGTPFGQAQVEVDGPTTTHLWVAESGTRVFSVGNGGAGYFFGNVGIGTTVPGSKLDVNGNIGLHDGGLYFRGGGGDTGHGIVFDSVVDGPKIFGWNAIALGTTYGGYSEKIRVTKDGNVGIGVPDPEQILDIVGTDRNVTGDFAGQWLGMRIRNASGTRAAAFGVQTGAGNLMSGFQFIQSGQIAGINFGSDGISHFYNSSNEIQFTPAWFSGKAPTVVMKPDGKVGIGTMSPSYRLQLISDSAGKPNGGSWANSSDERLKSDVMPIRNALGMLTQLQGVNFRWINPEEHGNLTGVQGGFLAQDVEKIFPRWIQEIDPSGKDISLVGKSNKIESLSLPFEYDALVVESIKELKRENDLLKGELKGLKKENEALRARMDALEAKMNLMKK